ncbi:hypothetical protein [Aeromonas bestiarum]|uniref:hypothetical protein n=1 Tax=Aeromonas bestiarum TaxID=105751 RepID=UPI000A9ED5F0
MTPSENADSFEQAQQDERWMRHAMALAARAEGIGEIPVGTAPMFKAQRQYKEVRA